MKRLPTFRVLRWLFVIAFVGSCIPAAASSSGTPAGRPAETPLPTFTATPVTPPTSYDPSTISATVTSVTPDPASNAVDPSEMPTTLPAELPTETPSIQATWTATATATATPAQLSIRIESADLSFGRVDASGATRSGPPELRAESSQNGAYFVAPAAVTVVVEGDDSWEITCAASGENDLSRYAIQAGRLEWRLAGKKDWQSFAPERDISICLREPPEGQNRLVLDLRLFVAMSDPPGPFLATLVFAVTSIA